MKDFEDTLACQSHIHCHMCRADSTDAQRWRDSIAVHYQWDSTYTCPIGLKIGEPVPESISPAPAPPPSRFPLPGSRLSELFSKLGVPHDTCDGCSGASAAMDQWWIALERSNPDASYADLIGLYLDLHETEIVERIHANARDRGWPVPKLAIRPAVRAVFRRWSSQAASVAVGPMPDATGGGAAPGPATGKERPIV